MFLDMFIFKKCHKFTIPLALVFLSAGYATSDPASASEKSNSIHTFALEKLQSQSESTNLTHKDISKHIVFIGLAPSPYTDRHDCMRAGFGIYLLLQELVQKNNLPISLSYYDGSQFFENKPVIAQVMNIGDAYVMGGSTWSQGPAYLVRRFFEIGGLNNLTGVSATAWATSGGAETGGTEVVHSFLRSMMGMGANVFTLGQKYMVFTTDERLEPGTPGAFSQFDMWYMDQFARTIAVQTLAENNRAKAEKLGIQLGITPFYFQSNSTHTFPPPPNILNRYNKLLALINEAADPSSKAWQTLEALISNPGLK